MKKFLCFMLALATFLSLSLTSYATSEINVIADLTPIQPISPNLEISSSPDGAVAVGKNLDTNSIYYYRVNGAVISQIGNVITSIPGCFPSPQILENKYESFSPNSAIDTEDREKVTDADNMPFSAICYIDITFPNGETYPATAFMISGDVAMTAAHCLYDPLLGGWATSVRVIPGKSGYGFFNNPFGDANAEEIVVSTQWQQNVPNSSEIPISLRDYDWGFIRLDDSIGNDSGYLGIKYDANFTNKTVTISGYPNPFPEGSNNKNYYQYETNGRIESMGDHRITHKLDTSEGQSGSPIFYWDSTDQQWLVVGIHVSCSVTENATSSHYHTGVWFYSQLFSFAWAYR